MTGFPYTFPFVFGESQPPPAPPVVIAAPSYPLLYTSPTPLQEIPQYPTPLFDIPGGATGIRPALSNPMTAYVFMTALNNTTPTTANTAAPYGSGGIIGNIIADYL